MTTLQTQVRPAAAVVAALCILTWLLYRFDSVAAVRAIAGLVLFTFVGFAVTSLVRAARQSGPGWRWPWIWLTIGIAMWCTSFVTWGLANMQPSRGDAVFPVLA